MYFDALNNFSSMHFANWKPLKVRSWPSHCSVKNPTKRDPPKKLQQMCSTLTTDHLYVNILGPREELLQLGFTNRPIAILN